MTPVTDFEVEIVKLEFVDEDDLPLSCVHSGNNFLEYPASHEEVDSDFLSDSGGSEADEEGESTDDERIDLDRRIKHKNGG